jgi:hypothetical protein
MKRIEGSFQVEGDIYVYISDTAPDDISRGPRTLKSSNGTSTAMPSETSRRFSTTGPTTPR